jgi:hypothetical protein
MAFCACAEGVDMTEEDEAFEELSRKQGDWGMQGSRKHQILRYVENVEIKGTSMTDKEAMAMALDALETEVSIDWTNNDEFNASAEKMHEAIAALKERLADPMRDVQRLGQEIEQEPTAKYSDIVSDGGLDPRNKFDAPPQRTEPPPQKKVWTFWDLSGGDITDAIKAKIKEKNQ